MKGEFVNIMLKKIILLCTATFVGVSAQFYEDKRCRCVCPTPESVLNSIEKIHRTLYIAYVPPNKCNCYGVILPQLTAEIRDNAQLFCPRCDCKYETRNTTVIMVVVILILWVLMLLIGYYLFLMLLEFLVSRKQSYSQEARHSDETNNLLIGQDEETDD